MSIYPTGLLQEEPLSFEFPRNGVEGVKLRELDVPAVDLATAMSGAALRTDDLAALPELSEFEMVRHFTRLSKMNVSIDSSLYPLGSCSMKYNPRINEAVARTPGFEAIHPLMPDALAQGHLEALYALQTVLSEVTGFPALSLQTVAGAQGELAGVMLIRAALKAKGEERKYILVPDSAHGTNPASAALAGYAVREVKSGSDGCINLDALKEAMTEEVAGLMLTNPNTLGIFEKDIKAIAEIVHAKGGYIYCDGANMNAQMGYARPADYGMDVLHLNLHKTFSTPHGGGGPGSGPVFCTEELKPYLPVPRVEKDAEGYYLDWNQPKSIGKLTAFYGNTAINTRALSYALANGREGLKRVSAVAVLNANYLRHQLSDVLQPCTEAATLHEVVFTDEGLDEYGGISTMDLAKRLIDYGFHPPTVYFPLTVPGALMMEPTETEPVAELDRFVETVKVVLAEAKANPEMVKTAPHLAPRSRLDETAAARNPVLRWTPAE